MNNRKSVRWVIREIYELYLYGFDLKKYAFSKDNILTHLKGMNRENGDLTLQEWINNLNESAHT